MGKGESIILLIKLKKHMIAITIESPIRNEHSFPTSINK